MIVCDTLQVKIHFLAGRAGLVMLLPDFQRLLVSDWRKRKINQFPSMQDLVKWPLNFQVSLSVMHWRSGWKKMFEKAGFGLVAQWTELELRRFFVMNRRRD